jgi:hypothetical protein
MVLADFHISNGVLKVQPQRDLIGDAGDQLFD